MGNGMWPAFFCAGGNVFWAILAFAGLLMLIAHDSSTTRRVHPLSIASALMQLPVLFTIVLFNIYLFLAIPMFILWAPILLLLIIGWLL